MTQSFEQTSEKVFNRKIAKHTATCYSPQGVSRYSYFYDQDGKVIARTDHELDVFEIVAGL